MRERIIYIFLGALLQALLCFSLLLPRKPYPVSISASPTAPPMIKVNAVDTFCGYILLSYNVDFELDVLFSGRDQSHTCILYSPIFLTK